MYQERKYRNLFKGANLVFFNVCLFETDLGIGAKRDLSEEALTLVGKYRKDIEDYIGTDREFLTSFVPIRCREDAPLIIKGMCEASKKAGVGPMAAVAGAVSEMVGHELLKYSDEVIVENGGDIFIKSSLQRKVGIYAGNSPFGEKLSIIVEPEKTPLGICTSSGTVGHSFSYGRADAVVILSKDTFLADAVATATGNLVKDEASIEKAIEFAASIEGVDGALVIMGEKLGIWGD
ncbi:MAG: UPF0280 family protein, partial [Clostridiaceae bacterium]|nr:UPF0280 family protein [Clostridiaceae bacterium]